VEVIAGLNVLQILNEPTAVYIASGFEKRTDDRQTLLVFDLCGGTFDVSIVAVTQSVFEVQAVNGDAHLDGDDLDAWTPRDLIE
jgi:molecular chaperone DnaK (HSP70)